MIEVRLGRIDFQRPSAGAYEREEDPMPDTLTREEVRAVVGPADDLTIAEIIGTGATREELAEAQAWVVDNAPMLNDGRHLPSGGRIGRLVEILSPPDEPDDVDRIEP